jgi:hypothetical protein
MSTPDQSIECQNPNCGWCIRAEKERAEANAAPITPEPPAPPMPPWLEKSWTEFGFQTFEQYENRLEWERTARDVCTCRHFRQEHSSGGCLHMESRSIPYRVQVPCDCTGWTERADSDGPTSTQTAQNASGVHRTADGQEEAL